LSLPRETALWVAFEHRLIEGADISRAVHEPNSRHCCGKVKQARASVHEWERTWRVGMISDHVLSPFGSKRHDCLGPSTLHYAARWEKSLGQTLIVLNLARHPIVGRSPHCGISVLSMSTMAQDW